MTKTEWRYGDNEDCSPYHYTACGLEDVYLRSGYRFEDTEYGQALVIEDLDGLHEAIAMHIASFKKALSGKDFRFLRKQIGLSQSELGTLMDASEQSIARWEKGVTETPGPADTLVRALYLSHAAGTVDLVELASRISKMLAENDYGKQVFEQTAEGWKAAA